MSELGQQLIAIVRRKASEQPDFVYNPPVPETCLYVHNGSPSCLIGHALWEAGVIDASLESAAVNKLGFGAYGLDFSRLDPGEIFWLRRVQMEQDNFITWAGAVASADLFFPL